MATGLRLFAALLLPIAVLLSHRNLPAVLAFIAIAGTPTMLSYRPGPWAMSVFGLLGYAAVTCLWSPFENALTWPLYLVCLGFFGVAAMRSGDKLSTTVFMWFATISIFLLAFEAVTGGLIRDLTPPENRPDKDDVATGRGILEMISMAPAVILFFWRQSRAWIAAAVFAAMFWASLHFGIFANAMAVVAGGIAAATAFWRPKLTFRLAIAGAAFGFLFFPIFAQLLPSTEVLGALEEGPASWRMRLISWKAIWTATPDGILPFLFGHGVEASRVLGESLGTIQMANYTGTANVVPTHPHNIYFHIWYELGLVGVGFTLLALWRGMMALLNADLQKDMAAAVAALIAISVVYAAVDASLWTLWRIAAPVLGAWALVRIFQMEFLRRISK